MKAMRLEIRLISHDDKITEEDIEALRACLEVADPGDDEDNWAAQMFATATAAMRKIERQKDATAELEFSQEEVVAIEKGAASSINNFNKSRGQKGDAVVRIVDWAAREITGSVEASGYTDGID